MRLFYKARERWRKWILRRHHENVCRSIERLNTIMIEHNLPRQERRALWRSIVKRQGQDLIDLFK